MKPIPAVDAQETIPGHQDDGMTPRRRPANGRPASSSRRKLNFEALEPRTPLAADLATDADATWWDSFNWDDVSWDDAWWQDAWWDDVTTEPTPDPVVDEEPYAEESVTSDVPVVEEPVIEEPVIEEPVIEEPVIEEPVILEDPMPDGDASTSDPLGGETPDEPLDEPPADGIPEEMAEASPGDEAVTDEDDVADFDAEADVPAEGETDPAPDVFATQRDATFQTTVGPLSPVHLGAPVMALPRPGRPFSFLGGFGGWNGSSAADDAGDSGFVEDGPRGRRRRPWPQAGG